MMNYDDHGEPRDDMMTSRTLLYGKIVKTTIDPEITNDYADQNSGDAARGQSKQN